MPDTRGKYGTLQHRSSSKLVRKGSSCVRARASTACQKNHRPLHPPPRLRPWTESLDDKLLFTYAGVVATRRGCHTRGGDPRRRIAATPAHSVRRRRQPRDGTCAPPEMPPLYPHMRHPRRVTRTSTTARAARHVSPPSRVHASNFRPGVARAQEFQFFQLPRSSLS